MKSCSHIGPALGLVLTPILALAQLTIGFALVGPACAHHSGWLSHTIALPFLAGSLLATRCAWQYPIGPGANASGSKAEFLAWIGTYTGMLFSLLIAVEWLLVWILPPCMS